MRAVFDTNIVVSALIFGGRLAWLRRGWGNGALIPVICRETAAELLRVLAYPKFRLNAADRAVLLEGYLPYAEVVDLDDAKPALPLICRDRKDMVFLALAAAANVPLVSGDTDLTILRDQLPVEILTVALLQEKYSV